MADIYEELRDFSAGVQTAREGDEIPSNALTLAWNTQFGQIGSDKPYIAVRPGQRLLNDDWADEWQTARPYTHIIDGVVYPYTAMIANDGYVYYKELGANITRVDQPFTVGDQYAEAIVIGERLFVANVVGEKKSYIGRDVYDFGLEGIGVSDWILAATTGSVNSFPAGNYDLGITLYNEDTGDESNVSDFKWAISALTGRLQVTVGTLPLGCTHWRVYLRRRETQAVLYLVTEGITDVLGLVTIDNGNIPRNTTSVYVDMTAAMIANSIIESPLTRENDLPPSNAFLMESYGGRLFMTCRRNIYWSKFQQYTAFPPTNTEAVLTGEGDEIVGLKAFNDDLLMIFTAHHVYGLFGNDPQTWVLKPIKQNIGASGHYGIVKTPQGIAWWSPQVGPVFFDGSDVAMIGQHKLGHQAVVKDVDFYRLRKIYGAYDENTERLMWSLTPRAQLKNTVTVVFNLNLREWEASLWDGIPAAVLVYAPNDEQHSMHVLGYDGKVHWYDNTIQTDGTTNPLSFTTTFTSDEPTSLRFPPGSYTANEYVGVYATLLTEDGEFVLRVPIQSNAEFVGSEVYHRAIFGEAVSGIVPGATYIVHIGGINFRIATKWFDGEQAFLLKRFDRVYVHLNAPNDAAGDFYLRTQLDFQNALSEVTDVVTSAGTYWGSGVWGVSSWGGQVGNTRQRLWIGQTGVALRVILEHYAPEKAIAVHKIGVLGRMLSDRLNGR